MLRWERRVPLQPFNTARESDVYRGYGHDHDIVFCDTGAGQVTPETRWYASPFEFMGEFVTATLCICETGMAIPSSVIDR
jgi:hypothetical protein